MSSTVPGRVLVVDDEFQLMDALVEALNAQGYEATGFSTGEAAVVALQTQEFDLLLTDLMMPGMDGISLLRACTAIDQNLVGIVMTGQGTVPTAVEAMKTGAFDYVLKPFRMEILIPMLKRAMEMRQLRVENIQLRETVAIYNLSQTIARSLDSALVLEKTAETALQQLDADEVSIMLLTQDRLGLYIACVRGRDREHLLGQRRSLQDGIAGWVARQAEPLILNGTVSDPRFAPFQPRPEIHSAISMPMMTAGKLVGVLNINSLQPRRVFTAGQIKALSILTSAAAAALQNESLYTDLAASEKRFRSLIEHAPDGIALLEQSGKLRQVTASTQHILGYTLEEAVGQDPALLTHPDDLPDLLVLLNDLIQNPGKVKRTEYRFRHKDGSWRWLESTVSNLLAEPSVEAIVFNYRDITERRRAEEKIQSQLKQLNALRMIDIAISSSFDRNLILNVVLQQVIAQLGADAAAILLFNPRLQSIEYAASRGFRRNALRHTSLKLGEGYAGQAVLQRKTIHIPELMDTAGRLANSLLLEGESFVDYYGTPLIVKGEVMGVLEIYHRSHLQSNSDWLEFLETLAGQAAIAIDNARLFEDLQRANTMLEQRVVERTTELNRTNAELERASRAKDEFLATMSHELRTPLNSILGLSESLLEQRRGDLNDYQKNSLQIIESGGRHLLELINDILDLSKIEAGLLDYFPQMVSVEDLCRSSLSFIKAQAVKKSIAVSYTNEASVSQFPADPRRLKQILVNLLTNAIKFTAENGSVTLRVDNDPARELIRFAVIDNGLGISSDDLPKLFQPFVQADSSLNREYEGTGLGLALVQKLTDLHGGSVQVESEPGKGSRFTINLSCKQDGINAPQDAQPQPTGITAEAPNSINAPAAATTKRGRILLAEDHLPNILMIGDYLESHGYEVIVAHDGLEAVAMAEQQDPDLILMDIQMPVMNGLEAIAHLRLNPRFGSTPIIALTALAMPGDRERCLAVGANEYMSKPVSLKMLVKMIETMISDG